MATIKFVALTDEEYQQMLVLQTDPEKLDGLLRAGGRRSGDKIYVAAYLIDALRLPSYYVEIAA